MTEKHWPEADLADLDASFAGTITRELAVRYGRSVDAVNQQARARGLKKTKAGDGRRPRDSEALLQYLLEYVRMIDGCAIWAGTINSNGGAPQVCVGGRQVSARRQLWLLSGRKIKRGHVIVDTCGERQCMLIEHLRAVPKGDLGRMSGAKCTGTRHALATALGRAKTARLPITERAAVLKLMADGASASLIASRYGVTTQAVHSALSSWDRILGVRLAA